MVGTAVVVGSSGGYSGRYSGGGTAVVGSAVVGSAVVGTAVVESRRACVCAENCSGDSCDSCDSCEAEASLPSHQPPTDSSYTSSPPPTPRSWLLLRVEVKAAHRQAGRQATRAVLRRASAGDRRRPCRHLCAAEAAAEALARPACGGRGLDAEHRFVARPNSSNGFVASRAVTASWLRSSKRFVARPSIRPRR